MTKDNLSLKVLEKSFAVCKIDSNMPIPMWVLRSRDFYSITRTDDEMSIISLESSVPAGIQKEGGWKALKVEGVLDFSLVGIISSITTLLAEEGISVFVMSTYKTDYIFIKEENLQNAVDILQSSYSIS